MEGVYHSQALNDSKISLYELIMSLYSNGVSTRRISMILKEIYGTRQSPSSISKITDATIEEVNNFNNRNIDKRYIAYWMDYSSI
jgi:putative transposase